MDNRKSIIDKQAESFAQCVANEHKENKRELTEFDIKIAFRLGAIWADNHPREGLVDMDKVCKWLEENVTYTDNGQEKCIINLWTLRDAMNEEK